MTVRTLLKFRNPDSTLDLNDVMAGFFRRGIVSGGLVAPVPLQLSVTVTPFKLIGQDGMVVVETSSTAILPVVTNQTNVVVFKSQYVANNNPIYGFEVLELSAYLARIDIATLTVFAVITLGPLDTQVLASQIDLNTRDVIDPVTRLVHRGTLTSLGLLPTSGNRAGDSYSITSGLGDTPALALWNGVAWINVTNTLVVACLLNAHRHNLFSNEIHLTDAQEIAAGGSAGVPGLGNLYVTEADTRLPTQAENDALVGLGSTAPSGLNPFVVSDYVIAQPSEKAFLAPQGTYLALVPGDGPFYVGNGAGSLTALAWLKLYHSTQPREYLNSTGVAVSLTNIYKSLVPLLLLDPSVDADANGFYNGNVYLSYSGAFDLNGRVLYGQQKGLSAIDRGLLLRRAPSDSQTSQETLRRLEAISGRAFDIAIPTDERNTELRTDLNSLRFYLNAGTAGDLVIANENFGRIRKLMPAPADFPLDLAEVQMSPAVAYTFSGLAANITTFDAALSPADEGSTGIVSFTAAATLASVQPGHLFQDVTSGRYYRILLVKTTGNGSLYIHFGTQPAPAGGTGKVVKANNPRRLELKYDHALYFGRHFCGIEGCEPIFGAFETLAPGGSNVGTGSAFTLVGQSSLPNSGSGTGIAPGRPIYSVLHKQQANRSERRTILIGNWKNDQTNYPRQVVGNTSQGGLGIEFTGYVTDLSLMMGQLATNPTFRVFVDGQYDSSPVFTANPSAAVTVFRGNKEEKLQPFRMGLALSATEVHTIRVEITAPIATDILLSGLELWYDGKRETAGRSFEQSDFAVNDTADVIGIPVTQILKASRITRYIDRNGARAVASRAEVFESASSGVVSMPLATSLNFPTTLPIGTVVAVTDRTTPADSANYVTRRVMSYALGSHVLDSAVGFNLTVQNADPLFRIPVQIPGGGAVAAAPELLDTEYEYLRLLPADWDVNQLTDVARLSAVAGEDRVTLLDDGQTCLLVRNCQLISTGLEGYAQGIRLNSGASVMTLSCWGNRVDFIFCGNAGAVSIDIEVDGIYTYTVALQGTGLERHTAFFSGSAQNHTVRIKNATVANRVVVGAWVLHDLKPADVDGLQLADYTALKTAANFVSNPGVHSNWHISTINNALVTSSAGVRVVDVSKAGLQFYGTWVGIQDFTRSERFGKLMECTVQTVGQPVLDTVLVGSHFEFYVEVGPDKGIYNLEIDGFGGTLPAPAMYLNIVAGQFDGYNATVAVKRIVVMGLSFGRHQVRMLYTGTKNVASSAFKLTLLGMAENPYYGVTHRRAYDDAAPNRLHFSFFRDLRQFATFLPEQLGQAAVGDALATLAGIQASITSVSAVTTATTLLFGGLQEAVVGSAAQVAAGQATHSSLQAAHNAVASGSRILWIGATVVENVTWTKDDICLEGRGRTSDLSGTLTFSAGATGNLIRGIRTGTLTFAAGADGNFISGVWVNNTGTLVDGGSGNVTDYIQET